MCNPIALVAVGTALSTATQVANASAVNRSQRQNFALAKEAADANALRQYAAIQRRQIEEDAKASQSISNASREARAVASTARVAAGEVGVAGLSVDALQADFARSEGEYQRVVTRNSAFLRSQFSSELEAVHAGQQAQILNALPGPPVVPDFANTIIGAYSRVLSINYATEHNQNPYAS